MTDHTPSRPAAPSSPPECVDALLRLWEDNGIFSDIEKIWPQVIAAGKEAEHIRGGRHNSIVWYSGHHALGDPIDALQRSRAMLETLREQQQCGRTGYLDVGQKTLLNALFIDHYTSMSGNYSVLNILDAVTRLKNNKASTVDPALIDQAETLAQRLKKIQSQALSETDIISRHYGSMAPRRHEYGDPDEAPNQPRGCWAALASLPANLLRRRKNTNQATGNDGPAR